jgi:hypothetical protein
MKDQSATGPVVVPDDITPEMLADTEKDIKAILELETERTATNADINAIRKRIYARGISAAALAASVARFKMDTEQREQFDRSRQIVDKALGIPVQGNLFGEDVAGRTTAPAKAGEAGATVQ